ncbi:hypothetical protein [Paenibacillus cremeus]|uniref:Uncharacterized protein n=1 Tax=Paenibacillus cremeus TaxID=2163881 RepID=A0A559JES2_9BACL|nr:hypothetical protein [Paenibacillus cremeus]TVX98381.1 hypothetical protein FPZ49_34525 [Paenibacillus cremeus]
MMEAGKQFLSISSKLIVLVLIAFPILAGIDYFTNVSFAPFEQYKKMIAAAWTLLTAYWEWVTVLFITPILCQGAYKLYAPLAEEIRHNLFEKRDDPFVEHTLYFSFASSVYAPSPSLDSLGKCYPVSQYILSVFCPSIQGCNL